jgi:hypothetical protein
MVKYAISEQKFVDWVFKTSFVSVNNNSGSLDQRHTYKLRSSEDMEKFIEEIKSPRSISEYTLSM